MSGLDEIRKRLDGAETLPPLDGGEPGPAAAEAVAGPPLGPAGDIEDPAEARAALYPLNDYGNGQRLVEYFGADMLFVPRLGWYRWDGKRWAPDEDELTVRRDAQRIAAKILGEVAHLAIPPWDQDAIDLGRDTAAERRRLRRIKAADLKDEDRERLGQLDEIATAAAEAHERVKKAKRDHRSHAKNSGNSGKITNMLLEARTARAAPITALNADPLMLNCDNGVLHVSLDLDPHSAAWGQTDPEWRIALLPHDRSRMISKLVPVAYRAEAPRPVFDAFLERIQPDPDVRAYLQRWFGYCLTGETVEQKLAFFYGGGRNGKSTLVDLIAKIMADYATTVPIETLTGTEQRKGSDATPDLVKLPGARFVRASEPEQGQRMKEALIKALTGGEAIMIRRMAQEFVEVVPEFKLTISGNHKPEIRGVDDGIWRRVMLVPFTEQIPKHEVDNALPAKLWAEREGVLAWMVEGLLDYKRRGLQEPEAVLAATEEYRQDSDPMRTFLMEECEITGRQDDFSLSRDLADCFNAWLLERGEPAWGRRATANGLKARSGGAVKGPAGQVFSPVKRSDSGYIGIAIPQGTLDRIAKWGDEIRSARARKG